MGFLFKNRLLQQKDTAQRIVNNAIWCLSNLCRGKPTVSLDSIRPALPVINDLLNRLTDHEGLVDLCWAISYLSDGTNDRIQAVLDSIDLERLVALLDQNKFTNPVLRVFGNIATGDDAQTERVIQLGLVNHLVKLIEHPKSSIRVEVCWFLSNLTAGTKKQIQV